MQMCRRTASRSDTQCQKDGDTRAHTAYEYDYVPNAFSGHIGVQKFHCGSEHGGVGQGSY